METTELVSLIIAIGSFATAIWAIVSSASKQQIENLKEQIDGLKERLRKAESDLAIERALREKFQLENIELRNQVSDLAAENGNIRRKADEMEKTIQALQARKANR